LVNDVAGSYVLYGTNRKSYGMLTARDIMTLFAESVDVEGEVLLDISNIFSKVDKFHRNLRRCEDTNHRSRYPLQSICLSIQRNCNLLLSLENRS
jgi:hypothetical protein